MSDTRTAAPIVLGIDLGTSSVKAVALGPDAELLGEAAADFPTSGALEHQAEQAPADWLRATSSAMRLLAQAVARTRGAGWQKGIGAIGLTGQLPTLVCLGEEGPLASAITWKDGRADAWASTRLDSAQRARMYSHTGMPIDGRYLAPMLQFHFADRIGEIRAILSAKDYLLYELTGVRVTEPSTAAGYGVYDLKERCFSKDLCAFWNLPASLLPPIRPAASPAGALSEAGAALLGLRPGIPVSTGAADSVCAAYAMAGLDPRIVSVSFGSSAVIIGADDQLRLDPSARYLVTPHVDERWYGREMDLLASGTGYRWLCGLFGWQDGQIDSYAVDSAPGARGLCFAPYLAGGEQGALWNPRLQGAIFGLNLRHSPSDIARAFLEGVFYEVRRCVLVLAESAPLESVRVSGNIVHSPSSIQMLADILDREVIAVPDKSPAAIGAALLARRICDGAGAVGARPASALRTTRPNRPTAQRYAGLYREYVERASRCG